MCDNLLSLPGRMGPVIDIGEIAARCKDCRRYNPIACGSRQRFLDQMRDRRNTQKLSDLQIVTQSSSQANSGDEGEINHSQSHYLTTASEFRRI
jgi:hypothetical protein